MTLRLTVTCYFSKNASRPTPLSFNAGSPGISVWFSRYLYATQDADVYAVFLLHLLIAIAFLLSEVLLQTSFLDIPYANILRKALPDVYGGAENLKPHPYFASGLLFVLVTALLLFFASGMYAEKIAYANRSALYSMSLSLRDLAALLQICSSRE